MSASGTKLKPRHFDASRFQSPIWRDDFLAIHFETNGLCQTVDVVRLLNALNQLLADIDPEASFELDDIVAGSLIVKLRRIGRGAAGAAIIGAVAAKLLDVALPTAPAPVPPPQVTVVQVMGGMPCSSLTIYSSDGSAMRIDQADLCERTAPEPVESAPPPEPASVEIVGRFERGGTFVAESLGGREIAFVDRRGQAWPLVTERRYIVKGSYDPRFAEPTFVIREAELL